MQEVLHEVRHSLAFLYAHVPAHAASRCAAGLRARALPQEWAFLRPAGGSRRPAFGRPEAGARPSLGGPVVLR
eukprot:8069051-Pyramimonas_sp.AAC.1